ncbi:MAG: dTDP-4-dehydrorhamnose 3,5-epimerase [Alphaproteobacteria bacterium]|nr:dTDP-4-dehydrorhamnose 3,5-epimerase [Alphaproteobacteria bacterium]
MKLIDTNIPEVKLVQLKLHHDARGFFCEQYTQAIGEALEVTFVQDNRSRSVAGVLRGIHYQLGQGKLVSVTHGRVLDVAVDLRKDSPTYKQHVAHELSDENGLMLWIPAGFGHGFCVLGDQPADVLYKVTTGYNPKGEGGIRYDDPELNIRWPNENPILSDRDKALPLLKDAIIPA